MDVSKAMTAFALGGLTLTAVACGSSERRPAAPLSPAQRLELAVTGVDARIGTSEARGSGIVIDARRGLMVTAAHTVWGARTLKVATAVGVQHGRIVARAPCDDLAVVQLEPGIPGLATLPVAPGGAPAPGQLLRSIGRRRTFTSAGAMASLPVRPLGRLGPARIDPRLPALPAIRLDSPLVPEVVGGPVLDERGRLVGMAQAPGLVIPWSQIRARLSELRPGARSVYVGWANRYRCVGAQHAYARATHPGFRALDARLNAAVAATRLPGTEG